MHVQDFAEQCLEKVTSRFARSTIIEAYSMFEINWTDTQEELTEKSKVFADYWQQPRDEMLVGLRHLLAVRNACKERPECRDLERSLNLWLHVQKEVESENVNQPAQTVLHSFLCAQTQSAACERTFAKVEELKRLGY